MTPAYASGPTKPDGVGNHRNGKSTPSIDVPRAREGIRQKTYVNTAGLEPVAPADRTGKWLGKAQRDLLL